MRWIETSKQNHSFYNFNINNHCTEVQWAKHTAYFKTKIHMILGKKELFVKDLQIFFLVTLQKIFLKHI